MLVSSHCLCFCWCLFTAGVFSLLMFIFYFFCWCSVTALETNNWKACKVTHLPLEIMSEDQIWNIKIPSLPQIERLELLTSLSKMPTHRACHKKNIPADLQIHHTRQHFCRKPCAYHLVQNIGISNSLQPCDALTILTSKCASRAFKSSTKVL